MGEEEEESMSNSFKSCLSHLRSSHVGTASPAISLTGS